MTLSKTKNSNKSLSSQSIGLYHFKKQSELNKKAIYKEKL